MATKKKKAAAANKAAPKMYRQGDVLIIECSGIPSEAKALNKKHTVTLAFGEVTGHAHTISKGATGYSTAVITDDNTVSLTEYLEVEEALANLDHQEHDTITLPKGTYKIGHQREYTPEAIRNVAD